MLVKNILCENAYYVEGLNCNLLSVSQLNSLGCKVESENKIAKIYDIDRKLIGKGDQARGNVFHLDIEDATCLVVEFDDVWLWHKRLCHVNFDNLVNITNMRRVIGFPKLKKPNNIIFKQCQLGKIIMSSFKCKMHTSKGILEIFHTDLCRPIDVQSYKGDKYIMLFIDDYSRMLIVMFLK